MRLAISWTFSHGHWGEKFMSPLKSTGTVGLPPPAAFLGLAAFCLAVEIPSAVTSSS